MKIIIEIEVNPIYGTYLNYFKKLLFILRKSNCKFKINYSTFENSNFKGEYIKKTVCNYFKVNQYEINNRIRKREIVNVRQIIHFFIKKYTNKSLKDIAWENGRLDHASCVHSLKTVNNLIDSDKQYKKQILEIEKLLK